MPDDELLAAVKDLEAAATRVLAERIVWRRDSPYAHLSDAQLRVRALLYPEDADAGP